MTTKDEAMKQWGDELRADGLYVSSVLRAAFSDGYAAGASNERADSGKDAARLAFLIENRAAVKAFCGRYRVERDYITFCNWCDSPREAIDAAILAAAKEKK